MPSLRTDELFHGLFGPEDQNDLIRDALELGLSSERGPLDAQTVLKARTDLIEFVKAYHPQYEPNWHHRVVAKEIERLAAGRTENLMILMGPRHGKSELAARAAPAWLAGKQAEKIVIASATADLAKDMTGDVRKIIAGEAYRQIFPRARLPELSDKGFENTRMAYDVIGTEARVIGVGVGGDLNGRDCTFGVLDDLIKNLETAYSPTEREKIWGWYTSVFRARATPLKSPCGKVRTLAIGTPWHTDDPLHRILKMAEDTGEKWRVVRFPAFFETEAMQIHQHSEDPRGLYEALWPSHRTLESLQVEQTTNPKVFQAQYQTFPVNEGGGMFKADWWQFYDGAPPPCDVTLLSVDAAFKSSKTGHSFVCIQLWGRQGPNFYLLDQRRGHWDYVQTREQVVAMARKYPKARPVLIEEAANGHALLSDLRPFISGLVPVRAKDPKVVRAYAIEGLVEGKNVYLPRRAPYTQDFLREASQFPSGDHDDQIDAMTQALTRLRRNTAEYLKAWARK